MTIETITVALTALEQRIDPLVVDVSDNIMRAHSSVHLPKLLVALGCARTAGIYAQGLAGLEPHERENVHRIEMLPDLVVALRLAADLFEEACKEH